MVSFIVASIPPCVLNKDTTIFGIAYQLTWHRCNHAWPLTMHLPKQHGENHQTSERIPFHHLALYKAQVRVDESLPI